MPAKAPLDVDLEDKLLYGLTPIRLAYLVVALLAAFATWSSTPLVLPVRVTAVVVIVTIGIAAAWGQWRGRAVDSWLVDIAIFLIANYRVECKLRFPRVALRRPKTVAASELVAEPTSAAA
jgi:hypothetical protein